ncbi:hypothetical protein [Cohnella boryungensis]|uniref:Uncharacterized protein n=1 Tax=Cohnella boryungensis TaxID=768479 RepID=A0ABV8SAG0_9BACL
MPPVTAGISEMIREKLERYLDDKLDDYLGNEGYVKVEEFSLDLTHIKAKVLLRYKQRVTGSIYVRDKFYLSIDCDIAGNANVEFCTSVLGNKVCVSSGDLSFLKQFIPLG